MTFEELRDKVMDAARGGSSLERITERFIKTSELDDDERSALWLVARSEVDYVAAGRQQRLAEQIATFRRARMLQPVGTD